MLDTDTRRRIDAARDILVGKVPDPKSQVEQITIALVYKFMHDMDAQAEELGGEPAFFAGEFERYRWPHLVRGQLGGHETLALYAEAIHRMPENPGVPALFRTIFANALLPYRDPETLRAFLKTIDGFEYDHSERLGDAFEYLLSVLGSQGDAGQFRTPRHVIDFVVGLVDPKPGDRILDPACGTAGFLISAYKHVLARNPGPDGVPGGALAPDARRRLAEDVVGYDISPDMVRLSLVNLYLHGFSTPRVYEYDTLTSDERWGERYDVILANPPFMSPKGGIRPHDRFGVTSKRSEVLFVDYIAEHLAPGGRAGVIVPEGVIFQSQTAYKTLRKLLVSDYLTCVVSLPAGVFQPYSGVKTSVLLLDRNLAKRSATVGFFKVGHDGFTLGTQRRPSPKNDLPQVTADVRRYVAAVADGLTADAAADLTLAIGHAVPKAKIAKGGDYNLSGDRYRIAADSTTTFRPLGDVLDRVRQTAIIEVGRKYQEVTVKLWGKGVVRRHEVRGSEMSDANRFIAKAGQFIISRIDARNGAYGLIPPDLDGAVVSNDFPVFHIDADLCHPEYLEAICKADRFMNVCKAASEGATNRQRLQVDAFLSFPIPLPPLPVQRAVVAEVAGYQAVIDGARAVVDAYRPHVPARPDWPIVQLGNVCSITSGMTPSKREPTFWNGTIPWISAKDLKVETVADAKTRITERALEETKINIAEPGDLLILVRGMGLANGVPVVRVTAPVAFNQDIRSLRVKVPALPEFVQLALLSSAAAFKSLINSAAHGTLKLDAHDVESLPIPLPSLEEQWNVVARTEKDRHSVRRCQELIPRMQEKIDRTLARMWGDENPEQDPPEEQPVTENLPGDEFDWDEFRRAGLERMEGGLFGDLPAGGMNLFDEVDTEPECIARNGRLDSYLVRAIGDGPKFGRVKLEKANHLIEFHLDYPLGRKARRLQFGPFDPVRRHKVEAWAKRFTVLQVGDPGDPLNGRRITYRPGRDFDAAADDAAREMGGLRPAVDHLLNLLRPLTTRQCELLATAYAAWNDLLIDEKPADADAVIEEVSTKLARGEAEVRRRRLAVGYRLAQRARGGAPWRGTAGRGHGLSGRIGRLPDRLGSDRVRDHGPAVDGDDGSKHPTVPEITVSGRHGSVSRDQSRGAIRRALIPNEHAQSEDLHAQPPDGHARAGDLCARPGDGHARAGDLHARAADGHARARDGHAHPADLHARPGNLHAQNRPLRVVSGGGGDRAVGTRFLSDAPPGRILCRARRKVGRGAVVGRCMRHERARHDPGRGPPPFPVRRPIRCAAGGWGVRAADRGGGAGGARGGFGVHGRLAEGAQPGAGVSAADGARGEAEAGAGAAGRGVRAAGGVSHRRGSVLPAGRGRVCHAAGG